MSKLPAVLAAQKFPVIASPLFIISNPKLVIEQCKAGVVGSMPALNARPASQLDEWLHEITETLAAYNKAHPDKPAAPLLGMVVRKMLATGRTDQRQSCNGIPRPHVPFEIGVHPAGRDIGQHQCTGANLPKGKPGSQEARGIKTESLDRHARHMSDSDCRGCRIPDR